MNAAPTLSIVAPAADDQQFSSAPRTPAELRDELTDLAMNIELLRGWWEAHGDQIRAVGGLAASRVHDRFVDAVCLSRGIARQAGITLDQDYLRNYDWNPAPAVPPAPAVGPAPALRYTGGTLGLDVDEPEIMAEAPGGVYQFTLAQALRFIDQFAEPGRTRLLLGAGLHYGVDMVAPV